jgi:putative FmdB family regulatory protein
MPIYEYQARDLASACKKCKKPFEVIQGLREKPLIACSACGREVRRVISCCHASVVEISEESTRVERKVKEYENSGMWSHAAELADKHSEKIKDKSLKMRALDDYKKAGYDTDTLSKHASTNND